MDFPTTFSERIVLKQKDSFADQLWMFFASVKLTVYTLVLLALTSIIGTVVLQNGTPEAYMRLYGPGLYNMIQVLDLDRMYQAWWYLLLMVVLCVNIVVCSVDRLSVTWKIIFPKNISVNPERFEKTKNRQQFECQLSMDRFAREAKQMLAARAGKVIEKTSETGLILYAEKGRWSRLGVYVVHSSVLMLLAGALIGSALGFKANLRLDEGQTADTVFDTHTRLPIKLPFTVRCNSFQVKFYDTGAPDEFKSSLTILENNQESFTEDILVNHPLRYKGINIFQASYGATTPDEARFEITDSETGTVEIHTIKNGGVVSLPAGAGNFIFEGFVPHYDFNGHNLGEAFIGRLDTIDGRNVQIVLPTKFPTFDKMRKGRFTVEVKSWDQAYYTGLQVTKDPGVPFVYTGFLLMIIGCWVTFFVSHQSVCIGLEQTGSGSTRVWVAGRANRNAQSTNLTVKKLVKELKEVSG
ncbi:ResB protein required for cytochrome c biosynthesis [Desulfobacter postgatei 2ac9]|uniref:ResB protein required for cytochrome c biosynthesis n=1 Tax=Desulfobacter postgatei 2ac9 TaxID=879212 RepID=I5B570_9BACT|nr:ResB protein required for cytochrome c biosynthesis [Desulfobacter postgatei 2ac9]